MLKGGIKECSESSFFAEIFSGCFSFPRVFFFVVRHALCEFLPVIYTLHLRWYPKRIWMEQGLNSTPDVPLSNHVSHHTEKHLNSCILTLPEGPLALYLSFSVTVWKNLAALIESWLPIWNQVYPPETPKGLFLVGTHRAYLAHKRTGLPEALAQLSFSLKWQPDKVLYASTYTEQDWV